MSDTTCLARLLSSAVHDLRNVLAVVRESSGLTADLLRLQEDVPKRDRMLSALSEVQAQVARGALLASAMDLLAECGAAGKAGSGDAGKDGAGPEGAGQDETGEEGCELNLVCQMFRFQMQMEHRSVFIYNKFRRGKIFFHRHLFKFNVSYRS